MTNPKEIAEKLIEKHTIYVIEKHIPSRAIQHSISECEGIIEVLNIINFRLMSPYKKATYSTNQITLIQLYSSALTLLKEMV